MAFRRGLARLVFSLACSAPVLCGGPASGNVASNGAQLRALIAEDQRIATVAFRIDVAAVDLCTRSGQATGIGLQASDQYDRSLRPLVRETFGIDTMPAISFVVPGSPAAIAGLQPDDMLETINGEPAPRARAGSPPTYKTVLETLDRIDRAASTGTLTLEVRRADQPLRIALTTVSSCPVRVQLVTSGERNSWADDRYATITTNMAKFVTDDDELAIVIGHELAHAYLRHEQRLNGRGFARNVLGNLATPAGEILRTEREADYLGLYVAARAGYDVTKATDFWRRMQDGSGGVLGLWRTHPGNAERIRESTRTAAEIAAARRRGGPLMPDSARFASPPGHLADWPAAR